MSRFNQLLEWLKYFDHDKKLRDWFERQPLPSVTFPGIRTVDKPPRNEEVEGCALYFVAPANNPKWVLFRCPCGCNSVITLPLQQAHRPRWTLKKSQNNRPILYPSVWRDVGCMSHFWVQDGRVYWCHNTGTPPYSDWEDV